MVLDPRIILGGQAPQLQGPMELRQNAVNLKKDESDLSHTEQLRKLDMIGRIAGSAKDQASYTAALNQAAQLGLDVSQLPQTYDEGLVRRFETMALSAKDRLEMQQRALDRKEARADRLAMMGLKQQELNATQAKQLGNFQMGQAAEEQYNAAITNPQDDSLFNSGYDPTAPGQWIDNSEWAPNWLKNNKAVEAQAAQSNWVETFLRDASGAAIPISERMAYAKDYFPQPGDSPEVVKNKAALRQQKMQNSLVGAGPKAAKILANMNKNAGSDDEAIAWAKRNPTNPKAKQILELNKKFAGK